LLSTSITFIQNASAVLIVVAILIHHAANFDNLLHFIGLNGSSGVVNGTAPNPVRFSEMCNHLGAVLGRPSWLPVPDFVVQAVLGEGALVVSSQCQSLQVIYEEQHETFIPVCRCLMGSVWFPRRPWD
jgi:hypothetical protein